MRLRNIDYSKIADVLSSKGKGKKGFVLFRTTKTRVIAALLSLASLSGAGVAAYNHFNPGDSVVPDTPAAIVNDADTPTDTPTAKDQFSILAEGIAIDGLDMTNTMATIEEQEKALAEEMGATYVGETHVVKDNDGNTQTWVSEGDYNKAKDAGIADSPVGTEVTTYDQNVFVANDGTPFTTEADRDAWNAQLEADQKGVVESGTTVVETEGNYYTAPDGSVWTSKEEYDAYINSNNGLSETPVENGTVVEAGEGYRDPNGDYWTSEAEYQAYIQSLNNNNLNNDTVDYTNTNPVVSDTVTGTGDVSYEGNYYTAPDGSVWSSKEEYDAYINSTTTANTNTDTVVSDSVTGTGDVSYEGNYYQAPDGSIWASEAEYNAYVNTADNTNSTVATDSTVVEDDSQYDNSDYYTAPDGSIWASEADYKAYTESQTVTATSYEAPAEAATETGSEEVVEQPSENKIAYDQYGGYVDPESGFYFVYDLETGEFIGAYESQADYLAILAMEAEESQKTR